MNTKLNKSDYILLIVFYLVSGGFQIYDYIINDNMLIELLVDIPAYIFFSIVMILIFVFWLVPKYIVEEKKYIHFIFFGLLILTVFGSIQNWIGFWSGDSDWNEFPTTFKFMLLGLGNGSDIVGFPLGLLLTKKFYESQAQVIDIKKQQKENELKLLRSQLNPHFLFNNLNTLDALIDSNPNNAKEYINRLALIYRYLIQTKDSEVMELSEELNLAENYIFLIKTRFENDYDFTITKKTSIADKFIPTGAILTLLENVIKHNKSQKGNQIKTNILIEDDWLIIINTKSKIVSIKETLGTGLDNLKARYQLLSNRNIKIIESATIYKISIPIIKLSQEA